MNHSHTSLSTWRRCKFQFYMKYKLGIYPRSSVGQNRGSAGHKALETYYSDPERDPVKAIEAAWQDYSSGGEVTNREDWDLLERVLGRYFEWVSVENRDNFEVVETELRFELEIGNYPFVGVIDGVVKDRSDKVWFLEHKFNKRVSTSHLDYDPQVSNYMLAGHLMGLDPIGVIYNIVRVGDGPTAIKEPVVRKRVFRNTEGLAYYASELLSQIEEIEAFLKEETTVPPYRNLTSDCSWQCSFLNSCLEINDSGNVDFAILSAKNSHKE